MSNRIEKRHVTGFDNNVEYRTKRVENTETDSRLIRGYGSVFNHKSKIITEYVADKGQYRTFYEIIDPHAFDNVMSNLSNSDIVLTINHQFDEMLARTSSGTLKLSIDEKGLVYETELPQTSRGEDVLQMVKRGDYFESSFQFIVAQDGDNWVLDNATGIYTRTITNIETLIDVTITSYFGAYSSTDIEVASQRLEEIIKESEIKVEDPIIESNNDTYKAELENDNDKLTLLSL